MKEKDDIINSFDPNGAGIKGNLFGLPFAPENSQVVIVPVPWEVTVSYHAGTAEGPQAVLEASSQVDLLIKSIRDAWRLGISMLPVPSELKSESDSHRESTNNYRTKIESGEFFNPDDPFLLKINEACERMNNLVKATTQKYLNEGKMVGLLGGDHSTPLGFIRALSEKYDRFGILQIDAHADLRKAYEGFTYSHASIMYNALKIPAVGRLVQVGIRDFCEEEVNVINRGIGRIVTFFDEDIRAGFYVGKGWDSHCAEIIKQLPPLVYISLDIDGLDPKLCPNTGTPVPGGLEFDQVVYLLKRIVQSGKKIIGFDLSEVAPGSNDWDANVGARMLYQLSNWMAVSQGKLTRA